MVDPVAFWAGALCLFGSYLLYREWRKRERRRTLTAAQTAIRDVRESGPVAIAGDVIADETFTSPIDRRGESVLCAWKIEKRTKRGSGSRWTTVATGIRSTPFTVDDGTGDVRVDLDDRTATGGIVSGVSRSATEGVAVDGALAEFRRFDVSDYVSDRTTTPTHVEEFLGSERDAAGRNGSAVATLSPENDELRFSEQTLRPGDEACILGYASERPDATRPLRPEDAVVTAPPADAASDLFVVSDLSRASLASALGPDVLPLVVGAGCLFGGLAAGIALSL